MSEKDERPETVELVLGPDSLDYKLNEPIWYEDSPWIVEKVEPHKRLVLRRLEYR